MTLPSDLGRPQRIVSLAPSNTEIVCALGEGRRLVAITKHCDWPAEVADRPRIGGFLTVAVDEVLAHRPDLVLASSFLHKDHVRALIAAEVRVLCLNPTSLREAVDDIAFLGNVLGAPAAGRELAARVQDELDAVSARARSLARRPRVYLEEWGPSEPWYMAGDWAAEMIGVAGGDNVFADRPLRVPSPGRIVAAADIAARAPDLVVAAWCGMGEDVPVERIARRAGFAEAGIGPRRIAVVDDRFVMRPGPRIAEGARRLHELFARWAAGA